MSFKCWVCDWSILNVPGLIKNGNKVNNRLGNQINTVLLLL